MYYPKKVKKYIDFIENSYAETKGLTEFNIMHLYPEETLAFPEGYEDSRFFRLIIFNSTTKRKRDLGRHDSVDFFGDYPVYRIRIFCDGSTIIKFKGFLKISFIGQALIIE